ncbi:hypothetical protein GAYE_SCF54G6197 [Galdieria yellowstonensis]|uniref:2-C-methyl-D-erythritol 4-phosphate cytidylyltransferase, chloroplastic n=1 Tax=Galdieria yellowstonensis TaxID=3028027 RepID=A0AAV9IMI0_9RHOD|nr:hypothetical protein GAYE_SCF54G6197 [Galdieria yellowstonensis]
MKDNIWLSVTALDDKSIGVMHLSTTTPIGFLWRTTLLEKHKETSLWTSVRHSCKHNQFGKLRYIRRVVLPCTHRSGCFPTYYSRLKLGTFQTDSPSCCLKENNCSVILLAGGSGKRMKSAIPKQYLLLHGKPVLEYSLELFLSIEQVFQVIIVMDLHYKVLLSPHIFQDPRIEFASPGKERQDSVYNGLQKVKSNADLVCIHDSARPLVSKSTIEKCFSDAAVHGAAVVGVPSKSTIKESVDGSFVYRTLDRSRLWEIQTPQVIRPELLRRGFVKVNDESVTVTDDVSIVEKLGEPVKLTLGEYSNIKLTTEEDLKVAEYILLSRKTETVETAVNS